MHNAPSVTYPVGRSFFFARLLWGVALLGLLGVLVGFHYGSWGAALACGVVWLVWSAGAMWAWRCMPSGQLVWRPEQIQREARKDLPGVWTWVSEAYQDGVELKRVERVYDLQRVILLRLHNPDGARTWVWVERMEEPTRWLDLRRALLAHA